MKYIHVFNNATSHDAYVNSDSYVEPSFVYVKNARSTKYHPVVPPISLGDIVYWDGKQVCTVSKSEWASSLGTPIGVVVIPNKMLPDKKARMISLKPINSSGNATGSNITMVWGSSTDTQLTNYDRVPITNNTGSTNTGFSVTGISVSDQLTNGTQSFVDPSAKYSGTYNFIPSPYLGNNSTFNPAYSEAISGYNNALSDFNGLSNTQTLVELGTGYTAANAAWKYKDGVSNTQWYLPAMGELGFLPARLKAINEAISAVGGVTVGSTYNFWSSTESTYDLAYVLYTGTPNIERYYKTNSALARPFSIVEC